MNESSENKSKVLTERRGRVFEITINRPESLNAIDPETSELLRGAFELFRSDDELWVVILTGAGAKAFRPAMIFAPCPGRRRPAKIR